MPAPKSTAMISTALKWVVLVFVIVLTIVGNVLVFLAVGTSRRLHRIANCFIVSLAVTDLLLGLLVLPFSATLELRDGHWPLGGALCNIYISMDVMLCTASILTLLAISVDRYLAISGPLRYPRRVTPRRVAAAIAAIWMSSLTMSFVPIYLGWNTWNFSVQHVDWLRHEEKEKWTCRYEWNNSYVILASFATFYLPLLVMCGMYHRIFCLAREQVRRIRAATPSFARSASAAATARENKATMTLAAILGAFVICWFPYFTFFTYMGMRAEPDPPEIVHSVVLWMGYLNSALNPILYPVLNRDFRRAYGQLLCCRGANQRPSSAASFMCMATQKQTATSNGHQFVRDKSKPLEDTYLSIEEQNGNDLTDQTRSYAHLLPDVYLVTGETHRNTPKDLYGEMESERDSQRVRERGPDQSVLLQTPSEECSW